MAKKNEGAIMKWEEELAKKAQVASGMVAGLGGSKYISTRGGVLSVNNSPIPGNRMAVVVIDSMLENAYYEGDFDPDEPKPPTCYAFGRDVATMAPHEKVVAAGAQESDACKNCPKNQWGSADKGRGKACKNIARIAVVMAGQYVGDTGNKLKLLDDPDYYRKAEVYMMKLPVTSVGAFAAFVKQVREAWGGDLAQIATKVSVVPDPKSQYKVTFEAISELPKSVMPAIIAKWKEVEPTMAQEYADVVDEAPVKKKGAPVKPKTKRY
jgi:hypothetical protein